jgi:integrase
LKPKTRDLYRVMLKQLAAKFAFLEDMTREGVRGFLRDYQSSRTRKSISNLLTAGRSLLSFHDLDPKVFSSHRIDPGKDLVQKGVWDDDEVLRLANSNGAQWLCDCITVAVYSGLRRQEVCGLVYDDKKDQLVVVASKAKTTSSVRRVPCHPLARDSAKRLASRPFPVRLNAVTDGFRELTDDLGLQRATEVDGQPVKRDFHALRHTFASKLASLGADDWRIARILGHARKNVTRHYAGKFDPEVDRALIERVDYKCAANYPPFDP